ncbi:unnamed protein product [Ectocarpus sp. 12 AP-2014]
MVHALIQVLLAAALWLCYSPVRAFYVHLEYSMSSRGSGREISRHGHRFRYRSTPSALGAKRDDGGGARGYDKGARVIVVGGSGRGGGSTVRALRQLAGPDLELLVGGRSQRNFVKSVERWRTLPGADEGYDYSDVKFVELDLGDAASLASALNGCDLVVHTAGPFQRKTRPEVLEAAIAAKVPYVDVCDDARLATVAKTLNDKAQEAGVSATISAGIWPGIDQLMAVEACEMLGGASEVESVDFSAYTAGTGNAGTTILSATFLILCEKVLGFKDGNEIFHEPASGFKKVDFGQSIGEKTVFRMNLIESFTCNQVLGIPNISTYFGTSPEPWNYLLKGMTLLPDSIMGNRDLMQALAEFSEPLVRITDKLVGATNAMRLEAVAKDGRKAVLNYAHEDLEVCVGIATAAFVVATLRGDVRPGVWFPEEAFDDEAKRGRLFDDATRGAFMWERHEQGATAVEGAPL